MTLFTGIMLLTSVGFTLGSTAVDALFFARFGVQYLPAMYMLLGVLFFLTSLGITALLGQLQAGTNIPFDTPGFGNLDRCCVGDFRPVK